ncbi:hypothetical protein Q5424_14065 [Conexibacter sp. JD483]|uniref:hypothetical protein n=1 Tax=unclassified Conexibacter TaxID=2627773 RepID=UPI00272814B3|nr:MULTISPECIES: hypothetical protein [unclassified Conexibacter]MDO8187661.1 hypothetical protein [Conexibacter sp. CPCC 205706]MDO8199846.1 hypothetical protein [Conexibacter sp. CPCC 205762]MDR9370223.1 hypothetical protein [Conexibacter sp. JD483]
MSDLGLDEVRVIVLPPPQTAAVNRLLREERGWRLLEVKVADGAGGALQVVYVLGHTTGGE